MAVELASGQMRELEVEASLPREGAEHQPRDQPPIGGREIGQTSTEQNVGIAGVLIDAVENLDGRHPRREALVGPRGRLQFRVLVAHQPKRAPASIRLPRRKSAAEILLRPGACTSIRASRPIPHWTMGFGLTTHDRAGGRHVESTSSTAARHDQDLVGAEARARDWPWVVRARHPLDLHGARSPVDQRVPLFNLCCVGRERFILRRLNECAARGEIDRLENRGCAKLREFFLQRPLRVCRFDRKSCAGNTSGRRPSARRCA